MNDKIAVYIDPPSHHFLKDRLFDADAVPYVGDQLMAPYTHLREVLADRGIPVHTADFLPAEEDEIVKIYVSTGGLQRYKTVATRSDTILSAFFAFECPINDPAMYRDLGTAQDQFKRVFSWSDSQSLARFTGRPLQLEPFCWPQSFNQVHEELWQNRDRKFMIMINGNKLPRLDWQSLHKERLRAVAHFSRTGEIDLYGREWDKPPARVGYGHIPFTVRRLHRSMTGYYHKVRPDPLLEAARTVYRGPAESKSQTLSQYTFAICFENMILKGWITEKIFDCFFTGTIPVYWGAPDITDHIPSDCFIDMRDFEDYGVLAKYLRTLKPDDIQAYRENARVYLLSPQYYPFTKEAFTEIFLCLIEEDTRLPLGNGI